MVDFDGREAISITIVGIYFLVATIITLCTLSIVASPGFQDSWNRMISDLGRVISSGLGKLNGLSHKIISRASSQAQSIAKSISISLSQAKTKPIYRTAGEWHHVVAKKAPNASYARTILDNVKIGYNSSDNLIYIKTGLHRRLHTNIYYGWANSIVISAFNAANGNKSLQLNNVINALQTIKDYIKTLERLVL